MPLVQLKQVHKIYPLGQSRIPALQGVDLSLEPGAVIAVWGPSGSGKSTLCNLVGTLDLPTSGRVLLEGVSVTDLSDDARADFRNHKLGFIFQTFNLIPVLTALENVALPLEVAGRPAGEARDRARTHLEALGLGAHGGHRPDQLSGGQRQRVAIARALVGDPVLVIADEPTANLDSETALEILEQMSLLRERTGATFLISTHDQRLLDHVDRRIHLRDGRIVEDTSNSNRGAESPAP